MTKVTNTSNEKLVVGVVEIAPHSTVEIDDEALCIARRATAVLALFAQSKLKLGDRAAKAEAEKKDKPCSDASLGSVKRMQTKTQPARRGVSSQAVVFKPLPSEHTAAHKK